MENKRIVPVWLSVLMAILCAGALAVNIYSICTADSFIINYVIFAFSALCSLFYCIHGFSKKPQLFYRICIASFGLAEIAAALSTLIALFLADRLDKLNAVSMISYLLAAILLFSLGFGKDLGKKASKVCGYIVLALTAVNAAIITASFGFGVMSGIGFGGLVLSVITLIMVYAKYKDKDARGTI